MISSEQGLPNGKAGSCQQGSRRGVVTALDRGDAERSTCRGRRTDSEFASPRTPIVRHWYRCESDADSEKVTLSARHLLGAQMASIALTHAAALRPIVSFLTGAGVSVDRVLATAKLPPWITADSEALIPTTSPARVLGAAARETGIPNLGLTVGERTTIDNLGVFGRLIRSAPTLGAALKTAVRYSTMMSSNRPLWLRPRGDRVEFCMTTTDRFDPRDVAWQQDNLFCLGLMIGTVRLAAGPRWSPAEVHLWTDEAPGLRDAESLASGRIAFRQPETMVAVPRALLAAPLPPRSGIEVPSDLVKRWKSSAPARDFARSIRQAVETLSCGEEYPSIRQTADFVGMSVRTLQRGLAAAGVSHEVLVAQTRFATAAAVLEQTNAKILDLALDLGYSDHANFTRAFRRWAGCSPQEYRVRHARRPRVDKPPARIRAGDEPPTPPHRSDGRRHEGIALATRRRSSPRERLSAVT
jgi:AraC-like DNA-binding protein